METKARVEWLNRRNVSLGWSLLWRLTLFQLPVGLLGQLSANARAGGGGALAGAGAAGALFALPVGGNLYLFPLAIPWLLLGVNYFGKLLARRRLGRELAGFVGWSIYWRWALLQLVGLIAIGALFSLVSLAGVKLLGQETWSDVGLMVALSLIALPALVVWSMNAGGWALRRVALLAPSRGDLPLQAVPEATRAGAEIAQWTDLFDVGRFGWNWWIGGAWAVSALLAPWISWFVRSTAAHASVGAPLGAWYLSYVVVSLFEGVGFAYLCHRVSNAWLLPVLMAPISMALAATTAFAGGGSTLTSAMLTSGTFALLGLAGLVAGVRQLGVGFPGIALGLVVGQLAWAFAVRTPLLLHDLHAAGVELPPSELLLPVVNELLSALLFAALLLLAIRYHLTRRGFNLSPRAVTARAGEPA